MQRQSRLQLRASGYYLRVAVPRDLVDILDKREIVRALGTSSKRQAHVELRRVGSEIDRMFAAARHSGTADGVRLEDLTLVAHEVYREELASLDAFLRSRADATPQDLVDGLEDKLDVWSSGLRHGTWFDTAIEEAKAALKRHRVALSEDSPSFMEALKLIARAKAAAYATASRRAIGDYGYVVDDPVVVRPSRGRNSVDRTVAELVAEYVRVKGAHWAPKTKLDYAVTHRALEELIGPETLVRDITRDDCRRVRDALMELTPNHTKHPKTRGLPIADAIRVSSELGLPKRSVRTVNGNLNALATLLKYAAQEGYCAKNEATGLTLKDPVADKDKRKPFSLDQLKTIFGSPKYVSRKHKRAGDYWVPLLSLWTGMRLNECCQLHTADLTVEKGVNVILITDDNGPDFEEADRKRVKTAAGVRFVPIHPELVRLGLLEHHETMKRQGATRLFPELKKGKDGYFSSPFSKRFRKYLDGVKAYKPKTMFHSFRHNYRDALREAGVGFDATCALGGWTKELGESARYGEGLQAPTLYEAICKMDYPGLTLRHLYP